MSQQYGKSPLWVITFDYESLERSPKTFFQAHGETPLLEYQIERKDADSFREIQRVCERMKKDCLDQLGGGEENYEEKMKIVEENIESIKRIIQIYLDLMKRIYPPSEEEEI